MSPSKSESQIGVVDPATTMEETLAGQMDHRFHHREPDGTDVMCCGARFVGGQIGVGRNECVVCEDPATWVGGRLP